MLLCLVLHSKSDQTRLTLQLWLFPCHSVKEIKQSLHRTVRDQFISNADAALMSWNTGKQKLALTAGLALVSRFVDVWRYF